MTFNSQAHEALYNEALAELGGNGDREYMSLCYIITALGRDVWRRYVGYLNGDKTTRELKVGLSGGEKLMVDAALNLYGGSGSINLARACNTLDDDSFNVLVNGLMIRRGR